MPYYPPQPERNPPEKDAGHRKLLRRIILCFSLLLIGYGGVKLGLYVNDYLSVRRTTQELREIAEAKSGTAGELSEKDKIPRGTGIQQTEETYSGGETLDHINEENEISGEGAETVESAPQSQESETLEKSTAASGRLPAIEYPKGLEVVPRIRELRKKSEYILGWIAMEGMEEPVVWKDNTFFLNHDALGRRNSNGAIFMDERTSLLTRPYTILLYGHNMKTGAMFGSLRKYENFSYFFRYRVFHLDTLYEEGQYAIFAVETIRLTPGTSKYLDLNALVSDDRETRRNALASMIRLSEHEVMLDVNEEDQLVLLITCVGDDDERLVVAARRLREGEQADRLKTIVDKTIRITGTG